MSEGGKRIGRNVHRLTVLDSRCKLGFQMYLHIEL